MLIVGTLPGCGARALDLGGSAKGDNDSAVAPPSSGVAASSGRVGGPSASLGSDAGAVVACAPAVVDGGEEIVPEQGASLAPLVGAWAGYVETFQFPSGSDNIALALGPEADGMLQGTVTFGQAPAAPLDVPDSGPLVDGHNLEGFPFTALIGSFDGSRIRFGVQWRQAYKAFCERQIAYSLGANYPPNVSPCPWGCVPFSWTSFGPNGSNMWTFVNPQGGPNLVVNQFAYQVCMPWHYPPICTCSSSGCSVSMTDPDIVFDMQVSADRMDGSVLLGSAFNVHLRSNGSSEAGP